MAYSADKEPDELTALTSLDSGDVFVVGDISDATEVAKYITKANLVTDLADETQTLTNKTINLTSNTLTGTIAEFNTACSDADFLTSSNISDTAYGAGWNADTTNAPSKNAVYDEMELRAPKASPSFSGTVTLPTGLTGVLRADSGVVSTDSDVTDLVTKSVASDINTGTATTNVVTPDALAGSNLGIRYVQAVLNGTTALTTSEKVYFRIPAALNGMNLVSVTGSVGTGAAGSSSSGTPTFTVKNVTDGNQMLSTSLTIDANEYTSATAATPVAINGSFDDVVTDDLIEVAVTTAGTGVTYAVVTCGFQLP